MNSSEPRRRTGLGAFIDATKAAASGTAGRREGGKASTTAPADPTRGPAAAGPPQPEAGLPDRIGTAKVVVSAGGTAFIKKTINIPVDMGADLQRRVGSHRSLRTGAIAWDFQDVALDAMRLGLEELARREAAPEEEA